MASTGFRIMWWVASQVASAQTSRMSVTNGQGCNAIKIRSTCCLYRDGRLDAAYAGQDCIPTREGLAFDTGASDDVCQPRCWVDGTCGDVVGQLEKVGECSVEGSGMWRLLGMNTACRSDTSDQTNDARESVEVHMDVPDLASCKDVCAGAAVCHGVEFSTSMRRCELWTYGIGLAVHSPGFECWARVASGLPGVVEQEGARVPIGGDLRFYVVGSSTAAWQTWPDQLHVMLKALGYTMRLPPTAVQGEICHPSRSPVCMDADAYQSLQTPRLGMVGWSTWGFAYESDSDCNAAGFREIAGYPVSCTNAWACNPKWTGRTKTVPISSLTTGVSDADVVVLANWINDGKTAQSASAREPCYNGSLTNAIDSVAITQVNLKRVIREIHSVNPNVVVLILARYPDTQQVVYQNERTLADVKVLNEAVKETLRDEPNTHFVDLSFPSGENMFQTLSKFHPNCRGDKVMASTLVDAMFRYNVLSRGVALGKSATCLGNAHCDSLTVSCCQRSALCYMAGDGNCTAYSPGEQSAI